MYTSYCSIKKYLYTTIFINQLSVTVFFWEYIANIFSIKKTNIWNRSRVHSSDVPIPKFWSISSTDIKIWQTPIWVLADTKKANTLADTDPRRSKSWLYPDFFKILFCPDPRGRNPDLSWLYPDCMNPDKLVQIYRHLRKIRVQQWLIF